MGGMTKITSLLFRLTKQTRRIKRDIQEIV